MLEKEYNQEIQEYIKRKGFFTYAKLTERLTPDDYDFLLENFPKTMASIQNGCKPGYLPRWMKFNKCLKRRKACNFHDFLYWIAWFRKQSDKLFKDKMNKDCKGFGNKIINNAFYGAVRAFGSSAFGTEEKTLNDFLMLKLN
jgi:hypothetical protein